jgi:hypothetical protein
MVDEPKLTVARVSVMGGRVRQSMIHARVKAFGLYQQL